jgi:hypothetical protein
MKVLGKRWFTEMGCNPIGVVMVKLTAKEMQQFDRDYPESAFIGTSASGNSEAQDIKKIVTRGARFPHEAARVLLGL